MQEVKNVIMECTDGLAIGETNNGDKDDRPTFDFGDQRPEEPPEEEDEKVESTGWDWPTDTSSSRQIESGYLDGTKPTKVWSYRNDDSRGRPLRHEAEDEEMPTWDWIRTPVRKVSRHTNEEERASRTERRSQSRQEISSNGYVDEPKNIRRSAVHQARDEEGRVREQRSQSRVSEGRRSLAKDREEVSRDLKKRDGSLSRMGDNKRVIVKDIDVAARDSGARERSLAKQNENVTAANRRPEEPSAWEYVKRERSASQSAKDGKKSAFEGLDVQPSVMRLSTRSLPRVSDLRKRVSSESEEEPSHNDEPTMVKTVPNEEPRVSDEESWEYELRLRRQKLANNLQQSEGIGTASEEEDWSILKRRSSAEGKMALLNDSPEIGNFGAWSISRVPNQGSSTHEHSGSEEESAYVVSRNNYRETRPPLREGYETHSEEEVIWDPPRKQSYTSGSQPTSLDEEEDSSAHNFVLKKESKRTSLQNLSKMSQEEPQAEDDSGWDFVKEENTDSSSPQTTSTGLFKRASMIKSQASEEDPEYLLPERPKLVEQEQEHPFKKAWQMQKSRSEDDGSTGFSVKEKDSKSRTVATEGRRDTARGQDDDKRKPPAGGGGQSEDLSYYGGDEAESTSVSYPASNSGDSTNLDWNEEEERSGASEVDEIELDSTASADNEKDFTQSTIRKKEQKRHSEESNWEWNQEET